MSKIREAEKNTDIPVEEKLQALFNLQKVDSKIDEIRILKGELPEEVNDLEDELTGLQTRIEKLHEDLKDFEQKVTDRKNAIKEAESNIKKYEKQQNNVKNNREFEALNKEIELLKLDFQLNEKRIKESHEEAKQKKEFIELAEKEIKLKEKELKNKKSELDQIIADTEKEEKALLKKSKDAESHIEERLLHAYHKIRNQYRNGLAVVTVQRDACGGCYNQIPPQRQAEIRQRKKIILCEHCGRILVDSEIEK